jgi:predicted nuclease of restriction endonuclease-like RecB superfamily
LGTPLTRDSFVQLLVDSLQAVEYLKHKIQKLNLSQEKESMILLVNRNLACTGSEFQASNLLFYYKKIPHLEIIKILRLYEESSMRKRLQS